MRETSVFNFDCYIEYLKVASLASLSRRNRPITFAKWAKHLGYRSPRSISMVLKGQRVPSREMVLHLSKQLDLGANEHRYFELLVHRENNLRKGKDVQPIQERLDRLNPNADLKGLIDAETFSFIAEWYHLAIKQLIETPGFREDLNWIRKRLRNKVTLAEIRGAIRRMLEIGVIKREPDTEKLAPNKFRIRTAHDLHHSAIQHHHKQMMERAAESLKEQKVEQREFVALTLKVGPERVLEAKQMIREFKATFDDRFDDKASNHVYQLNVQFFEHTLVPEGENKP